MAKPLACGTTGSDRETAKAAWSGEENKVAAWQDKQPLLLMQVTLYRKTHS